MLKKTLRICAFILFLVYVVFGLFRFGVPVRVTSGDKSIFTDMYLLIPKGKNAYITFYPSLRGIRKNFEYHELNRGSLKSAVTVNQIGEDEWRKKVSTLPLRTITVRQTKFANDKNASLKSVSHNGSEQIFFLQYFEHYYLISVWGHGIEDAADALRYLSSSVIGNENNK